MSGADPTTAGPGTGLLVGYGSIGRRHLANLHALGVEDWAIVHTGAGTVAFEPPGPARVYPTLDDALREEKLTFAVVANPTALHRSTAQTCLRHGCHVLLEKPVSHTIEGLDDLTTALGASDARLLTGFQFRFDAGLRRVDELLGSGDLGTPLHARATWGEYLPDWHPWEDWRTGYAARPELGGGVHHTICHPVDYLRMLFGEPVGVRGSLSAMHPLGLEVAEAADVSLRFDDGLSVELHLDYWRRPRQHRLDVTCTDGALAWNYVAGRVAACRATDGEWHTEDLGGLDARDELFVAEARHFLDVVSGDDTPTCTLADGVAAVRIADAVERSSARGGAEIALT